MTNTWQDIKNANVVLVMGGNAAEAHPCGFKWVIEAKIENGAKLVVVDPRFTRTASVADLYVPIRPGTDIAFLSGVVRYLLEKSAIQHDYVRAYTNAGLIVKQGFGFEDGLFTGYKEDTRSYDKSSWDYELDEQGYAKIDDTWQHPRCVMNLLRGGAHLRQAHDRAFGEGRVLGLGNQARARAGSRRLSGLHAQSHHRCVVPGLRGPVVQPCRCDLSAIRDAQRP